MTNHIDNSSQQQTGNATAPLTQKVWLLQNKLNPFPVAGQLTWDGQQLSLVLGQAAAESFSGWVAKKLDTDADILKQRLAGGESVQLFRSTRQQMSVSWPKSMAGSALEVETGGTQWLVCMEYPSGGAILQTMNLLSGRKKAKAWKAALGD